MHAGNTTLAVNVVLMQFAQAKAEGYCDIADLWDGIYSIFNIRRMIRCLIENHRWNERLQCGGMLLSNNLTMFSLTSAHSEIMSDVSISEHMFVIFI